MHFYHGLCDNICCRTGRRVHWLVGGGAIPSAVFHTGQRQSLGDEGALRMATAEIRQHISTAGSLTPRETALHSTPLRETFLPRHPHDARSALPVLALACVLRGKRCPRTPCPSMPHDHAAGGRRSKLASLLSVSVRLALLGYGYVPFGQPRSRLRRSRLFSTRFYNKASEQIVLISHD